MSIKEKKIKNYSVWAEEYITSACKEPEYRQMLAVFSSISPKQALDYANSLKDVFYIYDERELPDSDDMHHINIVVNRVFEDATYEEVFCKTLLHPAFITEEE